MLRELYTEAVTPALYEIGALWETGQVTVGEEHRASEIMSRVVDICSQAFSHASRTKGRAFITAAPGERHTLGARIVADLLEIDGWDVDYVGATSPTADLVYLAANTGPDVIGISVAMPSNLPQLATLTRRLRALPQLGGARIMVGGWLLATEPDVWRLLGADAGAADADGAVQLAAGWWAARQGS
jgi:methanogenic corrinoid protein MtbC1